MSVCECGQTRIAGKCPVCDVRLGRPGMRRRHLSAVQKERERRGNSRTSMPTHGEIRDAAARVLKRGVKW